MSGIKRELEDKDPDYEDISVVHQSKRFKVTEQTAREAAVQKIEMIMKEQFSVEMKNKEHEIEIIDQRLNEARRMMDKLRAYIVANYYASAGQSKTEPFKSCDPSVFNHPAIKKFIESPSRSSSPANHRSETPSANQSESESVSHINDYLPDRESGGYSKEERHLDKAEKRPGRNTGQDTFGVSTLQASEPRCTTYLSSSDDPSRLYVKKTIVVGNVSKYIPPDKREENDQSTHKWMVYVRGSRKEPRLDHFVKKVWFFLHPSYKPNDLVEVREPPFHLTRRGWGEFPVRVQIHFKDSRNKRIDIIHNLKLDRTYTGLQTLGAETVVDVDVCRSSLGEEYIPPVPSTKHHQEDETSVYKPSTVSAISLTTVASSQVYSPVRLCHESQAHTSVEKGFSVKSESGRSSTYSLASSLERTPTKLTQKIALGSHGNSAFQPITASCKIVPLSQASNPAESPSKSFQPITMSCKIVSGSPISTPSQSPLPRTPNSTPVHMKQGTSSSTISNQYLTVDKPAQAVGVSASNTGSPSSKQCTISQAALDARSPVPRVHGSSFVTSAVKQEESLFAAMPPLCPIGSHSKLQSPKLVSSGGSGPFTKVIIKQEPGEITPQLPNHPPVSTPSSQQLITVKTGQVIAVSPQKQASSVTEGVGQTKVVSIPVGSALQTVKQAVAISGGQILVAKGNTATAKTLGQKQVIAQGVAKAIVSGAGTTILAQPVQTVTKAQIASTGPQKTGTQGSVMATLQLPATNLANLANLPPGTKLYLTTNSKNPSGKGKLLLIPQGAILRASGNTGQQSSATSSSTGTAATTTSGFPQHLTYNSYVLKQTPQGTFLVGQPSSQASAKQAATSTIASTGAAQGGAAVSQGQSQTVRVASGQKATILTQVVAGGQTTSIKVHEGTVKQAPLTAHVSRPGTTTLRVAGGVITAASSSTAVSSSPLEGSTLNSTTISIPLVKTASHQYQPVFVSQGQTAGAAKSGTAASIVASSSIGTAVKTTASVTGMLKIQSGQTSTQQAVLTIPASQLKQLGVSTTAGSVQTILMPVSKVLQPQSTSKTAPVAITTTAATASAASPTDTTTTTTTTATTVSASPSITTQSHITVPLTKVKTEPGTSTQPCSTALPSTPCAFVKVEQGIETVAIHCNIDTEHLENTRQLLTAVVKKCPLIVGEKTEECSPFCATSLDQYYSWNIGKRRAAEWQRAVTVRRILLGVVEKCPRFTDVSFLKTKHIVQWCRQRGYTPPDLEAVRNDMESLEDILTQIDSEPECPSSYSTAEEICQKLEQLHRFMKSEPESDEEVDILNVVETVKVKIKKEEEEEEDEPRIYIGATPAAEMVRETVQQIGISLQPVQLEKNVYSPVVEDLIFKATERFVSDVLREALAIALQKVPHHRVPREVSAVNIHQAICSIPEFDFLTNKFMGHLNEERYAGPSQ
ncbi:YEATS domain-containing protein 2 isoform X2 [Protopterus annectens]|uniref:YEATS domain-containing protein 2 isoform X2 n=1 Tax=Protopterus annectens TaxID=7888 RepID=UPI001CFAB0B5|nr:YEATS domain-containing protein 2 isoform X2 [Protopterus annectens]